MNRFVTIHSEAVNHNIASARMKKQPLDQPYIFVYYSYLG